MSERAIDIALATTLAILPLLPGGPQYLGWSSSPWVEAALVLVCAIRLLTPDRNPGPRAPAIAFTLALLPFALAMTGAALVGLAIENATSSQAFQARLREWPWAVFRPIDQATDPLYPLRVWLTFVEGPLMFLVVAAICLRASDPRRRAVAALWGALTGVMLVSAFAIFQYFTRFELHPYWVRANPNLVRSHSTFEDPNALGSYLVVGIGIALTLALMSRTGRPRNVRSSLAIALGILAIAALATTVSRAAWGAAALAGLVLVAYGPPLSPASSVSPGTPRFRRMARWAIGASLALALVWLIARISLPSRAVDDPTNPVEAIWATLDPRAPVDDVLKARDVYWMAALRMAREHPIAGVGLGRFPRLVGRYTDGRAPVDNAHDFFLQLLAETGAVGLVAFLLCVGVAGAAIRASARGVHGSPAIAWGLSFGALAFLLTLLTGHPLLLASGQLVLASSLAVGLIAAAGEIRPQPSAAHSWRKLMIGASAAIVLVYAVAIRQATWDDRGDPWSYTAGLYPPEVDQTGKPFRWTGRTAHLFYRMEPPDAEALVLAVAVFPPPPGNATTVTIRAGGQRVDLRSTEGHWREVRVPLSDGSARKAGLDIRLDVDRVVVPSAAGIGDDSRALGAMIRPPEFVRHARAGQTP